MLFENSLLALAGHKTKELNGKVALIDFRAPTPHLKGSFPKNFKK